MIIKNKWLLVSCLSWASWSVAAAEFSVPDNFEMLVVNGKGEGNMFYKNDGDVTLEDNKMQQVVVRFTAPRGVTNTEDMRGIAKSQPVVLTFDTSGHSKIAVVKPQLHTEKMVDKYAKKPVIKLINDQGQAVNFKQDMLLTPGMQLTRDYPKEVAIYNQSTGPAALAEIVAPQPVIATSSGQAMAATTATDTRQAVTTSGKAAAVTSASVAANNNKAEKTSQTESVSQLKANFSELSEQDKKAFIQWAIGQM
ncbi:YccT family protein [Motilimonas pumila]|uniref:DUF2057 domain-containing protein n=1 Tax=Motilimonas pumila TaxID=2303987 RepID=A0A418YCN1_9GAMM|nr:DUF2057 domain-containing protein [Motilimonas pumila]RJG42228.1 DUF2057 domain-containing protein [Motilimonas pumila]